MHLKAQRAFGTYYLPSVQINDVKILTICLNLDFENSNWKLRFSELVKKNFKYFKTNKKVD